MSASSEKLARSLEDLRELQADGSRVFRSQQLTRTTRERLVRHGFLQEVMKGWLVSANPSVGGGDTTPWFASFWEFCRRYCEANFGAAWHLSPEASLLLRGGNTAVPRQVVIYTPGGFNKPLELPFSTSLFALKVKEMPPAEDLTVEDGLRIFRTEPALLRVSDSIFVSHPIEMRVVLGNVREPSELLRRLLVGGHTSIAGRLAGAFRHVGHDQIADEIVSAMRAADHRVRERNPFDDEASRSPVVLSTSPIVARLQMLWSANRELVTQIFPAPQPLSKTARDAYLRRVDEVYKLDAYHSLSIEGYQVTPELVQRVATGGWDPDSDVSDRERANALAARGYWLAFQKVRTEVRKILTSNDAIDLLRTAHREWFRELFAPHVAAGLLAPAMLVGYRNQPVYLRGSRHVPPRFEVLRDAMPALFDLIEGEDQPSVRAVLGHWLFGYVHPFPDGNGRIARFLMNALLASGGYPWTVIRVEQRSDYLEALEAASVGGDLEPFANFILRAMRPSHRDAPKPRRPKPRHTPGRRVRKPRSGR